MTRRLIDRLLRDNLLRVTKRLSVVDQALDAVTKVAMRNSIFMGLNEDPDTAK